MYLTLFVNHRLAPSVTTTLASGRAALALGTAATRGGYVRPVRPDKASIGRRLRIDQGERRGEIRHRRDVHHPAEDLFTGDAEDGDCSGCRAETFVIPAPPRAKRQTPKSPWSTYGPRLARTPRRGCLNLFYRPFRRREAARREPWKTVATIRVSPVNTAPGPGRARPADSVPPAPARIKLRKCET